MVTRLAPTRLLGLVVATAVMAVATQLLLTSFETSPLLDDDAVQRVADWIRDRPSTGAAMLIGLALVALGAWCLWLIVRGRRSTRPSLVTRRRQGWTRIDRSSLEGALERTATAIDPRVDASVKIRRGRAHIDLVTPDPSRFGSSVEISESIAAECERRNLPVRLGRVAVDTPKRTRRSRSIR